jgi:hypothetical protein
MIKISGPSLSKIDRSSTEYKALVDAHTRLARKDATLWGAQAEVEAATRLNWVDLPESSRELLPTLDALAAKHRDKNFIVLCGMGGSSLGPEVIAATYEKQLFILDSTDPEHVHRALGHDLAKTLVIVSSKSGSTIETASQRSIFEDAFKRKSLDPTSHMVFVTDPGSPLDKQVREQGFSIVTADPNVGGRFSVLTAFGLVPASLIGVGEDGPTHQPIEHFAALRAIPGLDVVRPGDANEVAQAWKTIMNRNRPVGILLSRQNLPVFDRTIYGSVENVSKGAYILKDVQDPHVILIATGSEVSLAIDSAIALESEGIRVRVVSAPCLEWFEEQDQEYKESVLSPEVVKVSIEVGIAQGWHKYIGEKGLAISLEHYGASADAKRLFKEFGFSVENIVAQVKKVIK